jgi:drug/metabolite transporter (DMT)-like permease
MKWLLIFTLLFSFHFGFASSAPKAITAHFQPYISSHSAPITPKKPLWAQLKHKLKKGIDVKNPLVISIILIIIGLFIKVLSMFTVLSWDKLATIIFAIAGVFFVIWFFQQVR